MARKTPTSKHHDSPETTAAPPPEPVVNAPSDDAADPSGPTITDARAAYESIKNRWKPLGGLELGPPRANVAFVAARVIQIGASLATPQRAAAFGALEAVPLPDGGRFSAACVSDLTVIGRALWYVRTEYMTASAQATSVALPAKLVSDATAVRNRMFKVVEYNCVNPDDESDPVAADLVSIAEVQGSRYLDLATDLSRLATYYRSERWRAELAHDRKHYRAADADDADAHAAAILAQLHQRSDTAAVWLVELYRGWADLQRAYDAVRRGAAFVLWPGHDSEVPPLGALRPPPTRKKPAPKPAPPTP